MSRQITKEKKLAVLELIKEKKSILFGSFQKNVVTKQLKEEAWLDALKKAQSLGLASSNRGWSYTRDHLFGLWKSRTLAKRDNAKKTGTGGGKTMTLDEVDDAILDILGNDSPVVEGLELPEADGMGLLSPNIPLLEEDEQKTANKKRKVGESDLINIKKQVLESELYINKIKIFKLEKELGLPPSKFTKEFYDSTVNLINESRNESETVLTFEQY